MPDWNRALHPPQPFRGNWRDAHLAQYVTQGVFIALAGNARQLTGHPTLSGWLHRTAQNLAINAVHTDVRRRNREQDAAAMNELLSDTHEVQWEPIATHLDAALGGLAQADRDAILLRYFEKKSAQEMADILNISPQAAPRRRLWKSLIVERGTGWPTFPQR